MKKIITNFFAKVAMVVCLGVLASTTASGESVTISYTVNTTTNMTGNNDADKVGLTASDWSVVGAKGSHSMFPGLNKHNYIALYYHPDGSNTLTVTSLSNATINTISITYTAEAYNKGKVLVGGKEVTGSDGTYTINDTSFIVTNGNTSNTQVRISSIVINYTVSGGGSTPTPSITAENVNIAYDATDGNIAYTIDNEVDGGTVSANVTSGDWVTLGQGTNSPIAFTCSANDTKIARTATVTLTYTYNTNQTVNKAITVTQAANPNVIDNISDITATGTYAVQGTIVAKSQRGFIVGDGSGYVYYYNNGYAQSDYAIGDKVKLSGTVVAYGGVFEFNSSTTVTTATTSNYVAEDPTVLTGSQMDSRVASTSPNQLSTYVQYEGVLSVSGTYYNITSIDGANTAKGSISYPINTDFTSLDGKPVIVKGYYVGVSSSQYYNTMLGSVEEIVISTPTITVTPASLSGFTYEEGNGPSTTKTFTVSGSNLTGNINMSLSGSDFEMSLSPDSEYASSLNLTQTAGEVAATTVYVRLKSGLDAGECAGTITLTSTGATNQTVNLSGEVTAPVVPTYAALPFSFDGGSSAIAETDGLYSEDLGTDYGSSPKLKFDGTGDYVLLQFSERPGTLTYDIKGNGFSFSTFTVQTSEDGSNFTDLKAYTELGSTQSEEFNNLGENVRYIKWIYTEKSNGNVALGNIALAQYIAPSADPTIVVDPATVEASASEKEGSVGISLENLTISDPKDFEIQFYNSTDEEISMPDWIDVDVVEDEKGDYSITYVIGANDGEARTAYFKVYAMDDETNLVYSNLVTVSQAAYVAPVTASNYSLFTGALVEGDYIIYYDGYAMKNTVDSGRLSYEEVVPSNDVITTDDASIVWHIAPSGDYWTIYNADADAYAAGTGAKNKAQMLADGTDDKALWEVSDEYEFVNKANKAAGVNSNLRNNGTYGFACYASNTGGELSLYKLAAATPQDEITITATALGGKCYATFYNGAARYALPAGAKAYTLNASHQLYLLGDGSEIPAGTAVIIIADATSITLSKSAKTNEVSVSSTNILVGSDSDVTKTGSQYVLGIKGGVLNFYLFNGTAIPAGHAYYVNE